MSARGFRSDNNAGAHPEALKAIEAANGGHAPAYGDDDWTARATDTLRRLLGPRIEVFFVYGGTGGNVTGLSALTRPWQAILCSASAHIAVDECGAPEKATGCKLIPIPPREGKLSPALLEPHLLDLGDQHRAQPAVVSVTQATEYGTVYSAAEMKAIADWAHGHGLRVHVDGARFANAVAATGGDARALTTDAGVDVMTFGGTKNGMVFGEAVVFFDPALAENFRFIRKQGTQLVSKSRFVAAQFEALLRDGLWLRSAGHANAMAARLAAAIQGLPGLRLTQPVQTNGVFASLPRAAAERLRRDYAFYDWEPAATEVRWMTAFDTTPEDVDAFAAAIAAALR